MRELVRGVYIFFVAVFFIYLYIRNDYLLHFVYQFNIGHLIANVISFLFFVGVIILAIWIPIRLDKLMSKFRFKCTFQLIISLCLLLLFTYLLFASHFYGEERLKDDGLEKIQLYYQSLDEELSYDEWLEVSRATLSKDWLRSKVSWVQYYRLSDEGLSALPEAAELIEIEVIQLRRNFHYYDLDVAVKEIKQTTEGPRFEEGVYRFYFKREGLGFKLNGFKRLN